MQEGLTADVPRRKRDKPSRLSRSTATGDQPKGKSGVDRFHYLFEAIEADKASDSETGNDGSSTQGAGQADDAQGPIQESLIVVEHAEAGKVSVVKRFVPSRALWAELAIKRLVIMASARLRMLLQLGMQAYNFCPMWFAFCIQY